MYAFHALQDVHIERRCMRTRARCCACSSVNFALLYRRLRSTLSSIVSEMIRQVASICFTPALKADTAASIFLSCLQGTDCHGDKRRVHHV